jgi:8-oxo-dGTP pyrophosphatase MutT (NUDIX family)
MGETIKETYEFPAYVIYEQMPEHFSPKFEAAARFLESDGAFLMLKRLDSKPFGGTWCLPGGKRESGETLALCAKRETWEGTGITLDDSVFNDAKTVYVENAGLQYVYHMFKIPLNDRPTPVLKPSEHSEYVWSSPTQALRMNLIPGQDTCIRMIYQI